jgi:hypothetical protein
MNYEAAAKIPQPANEPAVSQQLGHLEDSLRHLRAQIDSLQDRLSPVLRPASPEDAKGCSADGSKVAVSPLVARISSIDSETRSALYLVQRIIENLEV